MKAVALARIGAVCAFSLAALAGCSAATDSSPGATDQVTIDLWTPQAGSPEVEVQNMQGMIDAFTRENPQYSFTYKKYPGDSYTTSVQGAAASGSLPCMLAVDAPVAPTWAWAGWLTPLELPAEVTDPLIPGAKGTFGDKIYSVGYWDAGLAVFGRKSVLEKHDIRIPTVDQPWTATEFNDALATLKKDKQFKYPFSIGDPTGTGASYPILPYLWSFGGDMINRDGYQSAEGVLNGPEAVAWGNWLQGLVKNGYTNGSPADGNLLLSGDVPLLWTGNWDAADSAKKYGDDLVFLPPPDMGKGIFVGAGSFGYGASSSCSDAQREGVNEFLEFSLTTPNLVKISDTQLVIPATAAAAAESKNYAADGRFEVFSVLESEHPQVRPATPAFTVAGDIFNKAVGDIMAGADVKATLDQAVKEIDADIQANDGYGLK